LEHLIHASLAELEPCSLPARVPQAIRNKEAFKRAEKAGRHSQYFRLPPRELDRAGISSKLCCKFMTRRFFSISVVTRKS
jgi:hypothetical protein